MAVDNTNISEVVRRISRACKSLPDPSVTMVGRRWQSPYLVLISCIMSLRTKDETTLPASERLFALATTPQEMMRLSAARIREAIYPVGFYKTKAQTILGISRDLIERFGGQVPDKIDELLTLKGVGRKTANLVVIEGFHKPGICVDTHVHRISNRLGYVQTKTPDETEWALREKLPRRHWLRYNELLVIWGQNVCRPISPLCSQCPVMEMCARAGVGKSR